MTFDIAKPGKVLDSAKVQNAIIVSRFDVNLLLGNRSPAQRDLFIQELARNGLNGIEEDYEQMDTSDDEDSTAVINEPNNITEDNNQMNESDDEEEESCDEYHDEAVAVEDGGISWFKATGMFNAMKAKERKTEAMFNNPDKHRRFAKMGGRVIKCDFVEPSQIEQFFEMHESKCAVSGSITSLCIDRITDDLMTSLTAKVLVIFSPSI